MSRYTGVSDAVGEAVIRVGTEPLRTDWVGRAFRMSPWSSLAITILCLAGSWIATFLLGGAGHVAPHWFYVPILVAAARFGPLGAISTAAAAGILAGPLVPLDVAQGTAQPLSDWTSRAGFFVANGLVMALVVRRLRIALAREIELAEAQKELDRHKKAMIDTVSHEFRTPLTIILGSVDILAKPGVVAPEERLLVEAVEHAAQRLDDLVKIMLAASDSLMDSRQKRHEPTGVRALLERVVQDIHLPSAPTRVRFDIAPNATVVVGDPELLTVALRTVIDNALKFSSPTAPVDVSARRVRQGIQFRVHDRGLGMCESDLRRAVEPFTQADESLTRSAQGIGLGLFVARKTVEFLEGTIDLEAPPEGGVEATITIPQ